MDDEQDYRPQYTIIVPRIWSRKTFEQCKAEAMRAAAQQGLTSEPERHEAYDGWARAWGGPMRDPQGYMFFWPAESM